MGMAFLDRRGGHLNEPGLGAKLINGPGTAISHAGSQTADELEDEIGQRSFVRYAALDSFGNKLLVAGVLPSLSWIRELGSWRYRS